MKRTIFLTAFIALLFQSSYAQKKQSPVSDHPDWTRTYEPFRIAGNLYYVGTYDLACYLITTPQGHILINTGVEPSVKTIQESVEKLGFKFSDIRILLATHAHNDHVGALAGIKRITGAKIFINEKDAPILADGGVSDYLMGGNGLLFEPAQPDRLLRDRDTVKLGDMRIIPLHHPGHTKGSTSFLFTVKDNDKSYRVLIANMPTVLDGIKLSGMPTYPNVGKDFASTLDALTKVEFDLWLSSHASQFGLHKKRKPGDPYNPQLYANRASYDTTIASYKEDFLEKLNAK